MIQLKIHFAMRIDDARAEDVKIAAGLYEIEDKAGIVLDVVGCKGDGEDGA